MSLEHVQQNFISHFHQLRGFVLALVCSQHLADDIVQETFLTACRKAEEYQPGSNFRAWIFTIARFKMLKALRKQSGQPLALDPEAVELLVDDFKPAADLSERAEALTSCVGKLSRSSREAIMLRYGEDLKPMAIAARMGWSVNALNVALSRSRIFLRRCVAARMNVAAHIKP